MNVKIHQCQITPWIPERETNRSEQGIAENKSYDKLDGNLTKGIVTIYNTSGEMSFGWMKQKLFVNNSDQLNV